MNWKSGRRLFGLPAVFIVFLCALFCSASASAAALLDNGMEVNSRIMALIQPGETEEKREPAAVRAIHMADALPDDFTPSGQNTVSAAHSEYPIYIFFDDQDDAGILYFYTEGDQIALHRNSGYLFSSLSDLADISGLAGWDASGVVWMNSMFMFDASLTSLSPLADWDTGMAESMSEMFLGTVSLSDISALANWNTSHVTDMFAMFAEAGLTDALALRGWDTSSVTDMRYMFSGAVSMTAIDVSGWDTGSVTTMANMFQVGENYKGNGKLREILGIGNLDVSNVRDMTSMFYGAGEMTQYDIAGWDVSKVESMNHMFGDNFSLRSLDLSGWDVSSVKTMYCMFDDNYKLKTIGDVSGWNTASLMDVGGWLNGCTSFIGDKTGTLDLSGWNTANLRASGEMLRETQLRTVDLTGWTFESITNDVWEGAGRGIFYETGNSFETCKGVSEMFRTMHQLETVYVSQAGMDSFTEAAERGVSTVDMWRGCQIREFTVKPAK